jgi:hypothetical protein
MASYKSRWYVLILFLVIAGVEIYLKATLISLGVVACALIIGIIGLVTEKPVKRK